MLRTKSKSFPWADFMGLTRLNGCARDLSLTGIQTHYQFPDRQRFRVWPSPETTLGEDTGDVDVQSHLTPQP